MLKRNIAILIAGGLLSAQVNLAAADQSTFPMNADDQYWKPLPSQLEYLEQRAASIQGTARGDSFPPSADAIYWEMLPAQAKYFEARAASLETETVALRGDSFPPSADDQYWKMLPAQARYFEQREAILQARKLDVSAPRS
jgi:hypothetical protein